MSKIISFGKSDAGLRRANNEDIFILKPEAGLFAVADGMGGAASGEVASGIFSDTALDVFSGTSKRSEEEIVDQLRQITKDHSLVQEQVDQGIISSHEVRKHSLTHSLLI